MSPVCVVVAAACSDWIMRLFVKMEDRKKKKQQSVRTDYWLQPNIVVKVVTKRLGEKYHKKKAVITVRTLYNRRMIQVLMLEMSPVVFKAADPSAVGGPGPVYGCGENGRLRGQTETGPEPCGDGHTCTG